MIFCTFRKLAWLPAGPQQHRGSGNWSALCCGSLVRQEGQRRLFCACC
jgi:hypothetical protein